VIYNNDMDVTDTSVPQFAVAGAFLEALAAKDFGRLAAGLDDDAALSALLPRGFCEWHGPAEIVATFERWFGDVEEFEVVDASVGQFGARLQLRWRVRLRGARLGTDAMVVEQHVYADTAASGRIRSMSLLCSGYCREHLNG